MKKTLILMMSFAACLTGAAREPADALTAEDVLVRMPAHTLDILTVSQRKDLLDYLKVDSIYNVMNVMEGFSHINPPVNDNYIQLQVPPVTRYTIRILPYRDSCIAMTIYTVGDSVQAADSEIRFYDAAMNELDRDKFIKTVSSEDFLDRRKADGKLRKELRAMIPFPTVEYTVSPDGNRMDATLTVGEFLGQETMEKLAPYLVRTRSYVWNGKKWDLISN